jgi:hypothetical protein
MLTRNSIKWNYEKQDKQQENSKYFARSTFITANAYMNRRKETDAIQLCISIIIV